MKKIKRGQSSIELIVLFSLGLAIVLIILSLNQNTISSIASQFEAEKAKSALNDISNAAELVYREGAGAKTKIFVSLPGGINKINISSNLMDFSLYSGGNLRNIYRTFGFNVSGNISKEEGNNWVIVESKDGFVSIKNG